MYNTYLSERHMNRLIKERRGRSKRGRNWRAAAGWRIELKNVWLLGCGCASEMDFGGMRGQQFIRFGAGRPEFVRRSRSQRHNLKAGWRLESRAGIRRGGRN